MQFGTADLTSVYFLSIQAKYLASEKKTPGHKPSPMQGRLPEWTNLLNESLRAVSQPKGLGRPEVFDLKRPDRPYPFEDILVFFVDVARQKLKAHLNEDYGRLQPSVHFWLERYLLNWMADLNALPMQLDFAAFRKSSWSGINRAFQPKEEKPQDIQYRKFIDHLGNGGLKSFFLEYPVLARLIFTGLDQWISLLKNLILRLKGDETDISVLFNDGKPTGPVADVFLTSSDRHHNGQTVLILTFESGLKLVYKPKDIGMELAYQNLAEWLNKAGAPHDFKTYRVLTRKNHGWVEFINSAPIPDFAAAQNYHKRAGSLLCLAYVLGGTDLHLENIIVSGEYPVLIDMETLLHPFVKHIPTATLDARGEANELLCHSVIRTGMLPYWQTNQNGDAYDDSAIGAFMPKNLSIESIRWKAINTDEMRPEKELVNLSDAGGEELEEPQAFTPVQFSNEMIAGFRDTYRFFMEHRQQINEAPYWNDLMGLNIRFVFRPTRVYTGIHKNLKHPRLLKRGTDRAQYLDILCKCRPDGDLPVWWPLIGDEKRAMERMDVPLFGTRTDLTSIVLEDGTEVPEYFEQSAFQNACARLMALNARDLELQTSFIESTLCSRNESMFHSNHDDAEETINVQDEILTPAMALEQGRAIAKKLSDTAIRAVDGSVTWIAPQQIAGAEKYQLSPVAQDLYSGSGGIALFFAAMYKLTGSEEYKQMVADVLRIPQQQLEGSAEKTASLYDQLGAFSGWGSLAYCFHQCGALTGSDELLKTAAKAASRITTSLIDDDQAFDVSYGSAGIIMCLGALYDHQKDPELLVLMKHAGQHLLQNRTLTPTGFRIWQSPTGEFLSGYAHGAAGIAQSLLRLYRLTGENEYSEAALEAIAWEDDGFNFGEKNWPDLRRCENHTEANTDQPSYMNAWCNGAAGIGLARLEAMDICPSADLERDIEYAIAATRKSVGGSADYLCCGNFGRLELLLQASRRLYDETLEKYALSGAGMLLQFADKNGGYRYHPVIGYTPGFFQGISGIGYQLLRLTHPDRIPSVLTLN